MKNANIANIRTDVNDLFAHWVALTQPMHQLRDAESKILLAFLRKRFELSRDILREDILDQILFSTEVRREIMDSLGHKMGTFQNYLSAMRAKGVISESGINPKLIPNIEHGAGNFKLIFNFIING